MKKHYLLLTTSYLLLASFSSASAFWTNAENLTRTNLNVQVDDRDSQSEVNISETVSNQSSTTQTYRYLFPLDEGATSISLFLDSAGLKYNTLTGPPLLKTLWESEQRDLLQLGQYHDQKVLFSDEISLQPGEDKLLKLKYRITPEKIKDTQLLTIPVNDRQLSQNIQVSFNHLNTNPVKHFIPPANFEGDQLRDNNQVTWLHEGTERVINQPVQFLWSSADSPEVSYRYQDFDYHLKLEKNPTPPRWETVTILIDQSGSMFGERWQHSQDLVQKFLKNLPESTRIRVGFFDNQVFWFHEQPVGNSPAEQKRFLEWWKAQVPTGRTDWSVLQDVLKDLQLKQDPLSKSAGLIIGDFTQFKVDEDNYFQLKSFRRSLLLDYAENELVQFWSRLNDGQYQTVLSVDDDLSQWPSIQQQWELLTLAKNPPNISNRQDKLPAEINYFDPDNSLLWLSRSRPSNLSSLSQDTGFVSRLWAQHHVASDLRRLAIATQLSSGQQLALSSIVRVLGVDHPDLNLRLSPEDLYTQLTSLNFTNLWSLIWQLESTDYQAENVYTQNGKPLFKTDGGTWVTADSRPGLEIQAGSEAERQLFYFFPDLLSLPLSLGEQVDYCDQKRCLNLGKNGESVPKETHKLDWRAPLKAHWANDFALKLAEQNTIKIDPWGDLRLDETVSRGEFIRWLSEWYFGPDFTERTAPIGNPRFTDITDENTIAAEAIYLLRRKGVIQGYEDGTVRPNQTLTRAEAVKIILALDGFKPQSKNTPENLPFRDINGWEQPWVIQAQKTGLVSGYPDGTFKPGQPLTRGEGMKLIVIFD